MKSIDWIIKQINWKVLNFSVYFEILISYFMPFKVDEYEYQVGFPLPFLTVYDKPIIHANLFSTIHINGFRLAINLLIVYFVTILLLKRYNKVKISR